MRQNEALQRLGLEGQAASFQDKVRRPTESGQETERTRTADRRNADSDSRERGQVRLVVGAVSAIVVRVSTIVVGVSAIIRNLIPAVREAS